MKPHTDTIHFIPNVLKISIEVFHNAEGKEEFGEKAFMSLKNTPVCKFMTTLYKDKLYKQIKDYSNLPAPEECPVKAVSCYCL